MALYRRASINTTNYIHIMVLLPGNQFLLTRTGSMALWELSLSTWVPDFDYLPPAAAARKELQALLGIFPTHSEHKLEPLFSMSSDVPGMEKAIKVFLLTIDKMFSFTSIPRKEYMTRTLDQVVNAILNEGGTRGHSDLFSASTMAVLKSIGDSELIWDKRLTSSWEKKSLLQV